MKIGKTFYAATRNDWHAWLAENFNKASDIWLVLPHKESGLKSIEYNDAVEEALSFGWIDSTVKPLDSNSSVQRYTPRRSFSDYSQSNIERLRWLDAKGKINPTILPSVKKVMDSEFVFPSDILSAIKENRYAWANFQTFSPSYKRIRIAYIEGARNRPVEFQKRLRNFISKTAQNKQIGYGGINKYY